MLIKVDFGTPSFDEILDLRDQVLRAPLGLSFDTPMIFKEYSDMHYGWYDSSDQLMGTLSYIKKDHQTWKMRQVCVHPNFQNKGIGQMMVSHSEREIYHRYAVKKLVLHAREIAVHFYEKMDYIRIGSPFTEVGIKHFKMEKKLCNE